MVTDACACRLRLWWACVCGNEAMSLPQWDAAADMKAYAKSRSHVSASCRLPPQTERLILEECSALRLKGCGRNLVLAHIERMESCDLHRNVFHQLLELLVARHKVCLAIDLKKHADTATGMDVRRDEPLACISASLLRGGGKASLTKCQYGLLNIAAALFERALAIHHPRARALA
jgi:hypothetical protein